MNRCILHPLVCYCGGIAAPPLEGKTLSNMFPTSLKQQKIYGLTGAKIITLTVQPELAYDFSEIFHIWATFCLETEQHLHPDRRGSQTGCSPKRSLSGSGEMYLKCSTFFSAVCVMAKLQRTFLCIISTLLPCILA